jgi:dTDP-4-dehydrorhamnose reductase/SAM-dependent methyltransferase
MIILVFGAGGIIGQHMMLCVPKGVDARFYRRKRDCVFYGFDLTDQVALRICIEAHRPYAVVNLAGESNPDVVERNPQAWSAINVEVPGYLADLCDTFGAHYVHVSSQIVLDPVNQYGRQKKEAEDLVKLRKNWTIACPTFVLGVRPLRLVGRSNPFEQIMGGQRKQVYDRYFSPSFARDVARNLWLIATGKPERKIIHLGLPVKTNRHKLALQMGRDVEAVCHDDFQGLAPRPADTNFAGLDPRYSADLADGLRECQQDFESRKTMDIGERAREIALFLDIDEQTANAKLSLGFGVLHEEVAKDFRAANPSSDAELLSWYLTTEAYIWELSAYHADRRLNYPGMCQGIAERLNLSGCIRVLCLGDGIGDLTLSLHQAGFDAVYHDLAYSLTAAFADFRFWKYTKANIERCETAGWEPTELPRGSFDAVLSCDFLEHVTDVAAWTGAIRAALKPGGLFFAQNAFACGSGPEGSIPMHLARNDHFEKDWDTHLADLGFIRESSNWYCWPGPPINP